MARKRWIGVTECQHRTLHLPQSRECFACWLRRIEHEEAMREALPFEAGAEDTQHWDDFAEAIKQA